MAFLHVMWQITLLLCHISSKQKSRSFETLICVLISFWILSFYSRIVQGFSPKLSPKVKPPSPPKSPPRLLASPPYILESRKKPYPVLDMVFLFLSFLLLESLGNIMLFTYYACASDS